MPQLGADPGAARIDVAGRKGWRLSDGSTLWDDGEKEVPTSGLSDEHKRNLARIAAGEAWEPTVNAVSDTEITALKAHFAPADDPEAPLELRKAAARTRSSHKSGAEPVLTPDQVRIEAHKLLEREIDRLEELKSMAIAGLLLLAHGGVRVPGGNPPMRLHEVVLTLLRTADSGSAAEMVKALETARAWQPLSADLHDAETLPQPPGGPLKPVTIPPVFPDGSTQQGSDAVNRGGQPTEPPPDEP